MASQAKPRSPLLSQPGPCSRAGLRNREPEPRAGIQPRTSPPSTRGPPQKLSAIHDAAGLEALRPAPVLDGPPSDEVSSPPIAPKASSTWPSIPCRKHRPENNKAPPSRQCLVLQRWFFTQLTVSLRVTLTPSTTNEYVYCPAASSVTSTSWRCNPGCNAPKSSSTINFPCRLRNSSDTSFV